MKNAICYLNGRYLPVRDATISATDRGFLFGEGLFETWKTYRGRPFAVREHLARMAKSARAIGIDFDAAENWAARTEQLAKRNHMTDQGGAVRFTITRGSGEVSLVPPKLVKPTRLMLFRPLEPGLLEARRRGVSVHLMDFGSGVSPAFRNLKTLNYLPAVRGKLEARRGGAFESLYRLADDTILEGTTSNFFVLRKGRLITTPVTTGILPGVTRSLVIKLARKVVEVEERRIDTDDLRRASEIFLTSSTIEVVPVVKIDRHAVAGGSPGELTGLLQQRYRAMVARRVHLPASELGI